MKKSLLLLSLSTAFFLQGCGINDGPSRIVSSSNGSSNADPVAGSGLVFSSVALTSLTVSWGQASDDTTASVDLSYKLVYSTTSSAIDTVAEVDALSGAPVLMNWTANTLTSNVTGLSPSTQYYFAALVRDSAGKKALYAPVSQTTSSDNTVPMIGTGIVFSSVADNSMTVSWGQASDDNTSTAQLEYKLVYSTTSTAIDTIAEVDALSGGPVLMDWTANTTSVNAMGLAFATQYYFAVLVRDSIGNKALYSPAGQATPNPMPVVGTAITYTNVDYTSLTVNWGAASDDATPAAQLQYKLVYAMSSAAIDTVAEADALGGASIVMNWTANTTTADVLGLTETTQYYYAVLVRDAANNMALYAPAGQITPTPPAPSNLLAHWKFDNSLLDEKGVRHFTGINSPTFSTSSVKFGTHSVRLNGIDQYLTSNFQFNGMANFTMAGWVYLESMPPLVLYNKVGFWGQNDLIEMGIVYKTGYSGFRLCLWVAGSTDACDTVDFPTGQWVHVTITGSTTAGTAVFKNGQRVASSINTNAGTSTDFLKVGYAVWGPPGGSEEYPLHGFIDELAIWSRVLSDAEIADLANL